MPSKSIGKILSWKNLKLLVYGDEEGKESYKIIDIEKPPEMPAFQTTKRFNSLEAQSKFFSYNGKVMNNIPIKRHYCICGVKKKDRFRRGKNLQRTALQNRFNQEAPETELQTVIYLNKLKKSGNKRKKGSGKKTKEAVDKKTK